MPIVFVQGVSTRPGPDYDRRVSNRDALLRSALTTRVFQRMPPALGEGIFRYQAACVCPENITLNLTTVNLPKAGVRRIDQADGPVKEVWLLHPPTI